MGTGHAGRYWTLGGLLAAVLLMTAGWFLLIGPQRGETDSLTEQAAATQDRVTGLRRHLVELREQQANLGAYSAALARDQRALPASSGVPDFLRELQAAGDALGVKVSGVVVGAPTDVAGTTTKVYALPITVTADGGASRLDRFLDRLQRVQPRAVLITSVAADTAEGADTFDDGVRLTIGLQAFVAPELGAD